MNTPKTEQDRIDREAAEWVVRWEDRESHPPAKDQFRWFGWLQRSPRHVQAYFDTAGVYEQLGRIDPECRIDIDEWLAERPAPVIGIERPGGDGKVHSRVAASGSVLVHTRRWYVFPLGAAAASLITGVVLWNLVSHDVGAYRTEVGQQSVSRLPDGSVMNLNTRSTAKVRYSETERLIELEGEALFTVARDASRPFYVRTAGATIRAVGTKFNVYTQGSETRVAVVEGRVQITPPRDEHAMIALAAGEAAQVSEGRIEKHATPDVDKTIAWQRQLLVFEDATLAEVVAQFNRYNTRQIRVAGGLGEKRLSGTFDALYPQSLLLYLQKDRELDVRYSHDEVIVQHAP